MKKIEADLKYYNANTRNAHVGDCVKRGLSVAYSMDYDAVSAELNRIKRSMGLSEFNINPVFEKFMKNRGDVFTRVPESEQVTAEEFCEQHPTGVYVVLVGKSISKTSTHLAAIVDGDLFDSWNSLDYYVKQYSKITQGKSDIYEFDVDYICKQVAATVQQYVKKTLDSKMPDNMHVYMSGSITREDKYSDAITVYCDLGVMSEYCRYRSNCTLIHDVILKTNPRLSEEENIASLTKKTKQKVYDWVYNTKAEIIEAEKLENIGVNRHFYTNERGNGSILAKMPEWAIPLIYRIYDNGQGYDYSERYEVEMEALPDDPRYNNNPTVDFYADNVRELRWRIEQYKEDYSRINYDY